MRILLVSHRFPPHSAAGTEVYTAELAQRLLARGHEVSVFSSFKDTGRADLEVHRREHAGHQVCEVINNLYYESFDQTWEHPGIEEAFRVELTHQRPDVVHFHHLMYLSVGCLEAARESGAAVLMTLHDFWFECPRMGQLVHADGELCEQVDVQRCQSCLPSFAWKQGPSARRTGRVLASIQRGTGLDFGPLARRVGGLITRGDDCTESSSQAPQILADAITRRTEELRRRVPAAVMRFLAPSEFLRKRLVDWGLDAGCVYYTPTGLDRMELERENAPTPGVREVLFLGSFVPLKGAHVLLRAWERLDESVRAGATLRLFGPDQFHASYVRDLRSQARRVGAEFGPALDREGVRQALARADLLVVPSLWFENRPLVLMEALGAGVPSLVTDLGGMAELVPDQERRFPVGDAEQLSVLLESWLLRPPEDLSMPVNESFPSWDESAEQILHHYQDCLNERGEAS